MFMGGTGAIAIKKQGLSNAAVVQIEAQAK